MKKVRKKKNIKGVTLIELLVVVAIITILAAIILPYIGNRTEDAKIAAMEDIIANVRTATLLMFNDTSNFSARWDDLILNATPLPNWRGPYISARYQLGKTNTDNDTAVTASPWKTNLVLFADNNSANLEYFGSTSGGIPQFSRSVALGLINTVSSGQPAIPLSSLLKIDQDLDDGLNNTGYIIYLNITTTPITAGGLAAGNFQSYTNAPGGTTMLAILLNGVK
ncbi:MAG: prepilin-type N-terminal cleavage/methylation domain-containing protein [bacterium]